MSRHSAGPGVPAFPVSVDARGHEPKHARKDKPRGKKVKVEARAA